ncbi:hypothetical protein [Caproicibacter sp. BJN0012]|uniref:hypothetical protein n=1 Tax=Caproicibacter sp. BJN0012 TaxID=3110227 RepID=UPI002E1491FE
MNEFEELAATSQAACRLDFERILRLPQKELKAALAEELQEQSYEVKVKNGFLYAPGDLPVLLIAHLDTVHRYPVKHICYSKDGRIVMSPEGIGGDDRAGVYMILKIIEQANCHVLFCEDEETGGRGAQKFTHSRISPDINYIVELDRRGANDAVFYGCNNPDFTEFVCGFGFQEAYGTFSDISVVAPHLGIAAVNISAGYYNEHRTHEHIDLEQVENNVARIRQMVQTPIQWFEYIPQRQRNLFGDYDYETVPMWGFDYGAPSEKLISPREPLMRLPDTAYLIINGQRMKNCARYYIDHKGNIYDYLPELDAAVLTEHATAFEMSGEPLAFTAGGTERIRVISLEEAMELLQVV